MFGEPGYSEGLYWAMGSSSAPMMAMARKTNEIVCDLRSPVLLGEEAPRSCWGQPTGEKREKEQGRESLEKDVAENR